MKNKIQAVLLSAGILLGGFLATFLPNVIYGYFLGVTRVKPLNLSATQISFKLDEVFPYLILSLFSLLLLYQRQPLSLRIRRLCGISVAFILMFIGTFDANRPIYDVGPGLGFFTFLFIPPLYVLGYFLGWLWEMISGVKEEPHSSGSGSKGKVGNDL